MFSASFLFDIVSNNSTVLLIRYLEMIEDGKSLGPSGAWGGEGKGLSFRL